MENKHYDYLIVGSGITGSTLARLLTDQGKKCLVLEARDIIGGNVATEVKDGIPIHLHGPHIFHTSYENVWSFINKYCKMLPFINSPLANFHGKLYHMPFNMNTFHELFGVNTPEEAKAVIQKEIDEAHITNPSNLEEQAIALVGTTIYKTLIKEYTEKQWGKSCKELPSFIIKRLPLRFEYNNNYFNDTYQGIPEGGFSILIENLLKGIDVKTNTNYLNDKQYFDSLADKIIFTGRIDEYFSFKYGHLEYRSLRFETKKYNVNHYQENAVINFTSHDVTYTRITEHKYFDSSVNNTTSTYITEEYPQTFIEGMVPYYTINDEKNNTMYSLYEKETSKLPNVLFFGRLARYKYYDMDDAIEECLNFIERNK